MSCPLLFLSMLCSFEYPETTPCKASCSFLWTLWDLCRALWDVSRQCGVPCYQESDIQYEPVLHAWWVVKFLSWLQGVLGHTLSPVRQLFERIASPSAAADAESRFQHFKKHVWLRIKESGSSGNNCHFLYICRCQVLPCCSSLLDSAGWLSQSLQACCKCSL